MIRLFLAIALISCSSLVFADENQKVLKSFDDIAADLKAKKQDLEPFDKKKIKIDLESLGLDDVENSNKTDVVKDAPKAEAKSDSPPAVVKPEDSLEAKSVIIPDKKDDQKSSTLKSETLPSLTSFSMEKAVAAQIEQAKQQQPIKAAKEIKKGTDVKKPVKGKNKSSKYADSTKKLKNRISFEKYKKGQTAVEKIESQKSKELNILREKYLTQFTSDNSEMIGDEKFLPEDEKIIPRRKEVGKFDNNEAPPSPILNRYRTSENVHIPTILTKEEKIEMLFGTAASVNTALFNDAFKYIENPNVKNKQGDTILTFTALLQKYSAMASILEKGADPNMPNKLGYTPLNVAIELLDSKSFELLFNSGADIKYVDGLGKSYLMHAAKVGFLTGVELLVKNGIDINAMDSEGFTALSIAHRYKRDVIVKYLLKNNAKTWIETPYDSEAQSIMRELEDRWK